MGIGTGEAETIASADLDVTRERRILALYESVVELPDHARDAELLTEEPAITNAVRALIARDARTTMLRTVSSEDHPDELLPERIGPYRVVEVLGRGGMGTVLLGERDDGLFEHRVAIKLLRAGLFSPRAREQFGVERGILARLHHPHIAHLLGGGLDADGRSYIVMELLHGVPITEHADAHQFGLQERISLFLQACDAAEYAHRNLIVHSDIKPSNVLVTEAFGVKLVDFGIARVLNQDDGTAALGHTPGYASQAQRAGLPPTPADDVFALGKLLAALLDGFHLDADLRAVIDAAGAEPPAYGAVSELVADLARWRDHQPVTVRRSEPLRRILLYWRRHRVGVAVVAGTILLLALSTVVATSLYVRAARAQAAAEARFEQTRGLSRFLIDDVAQALAPIPGSAGIRRAIAERANRTFAELGRVPGASDALRIDSAEAYTQIGSIFANASIREGADPAGAERAFGRAVDDLVALHRADPHRQDVSLALARALVERSRSLSRNQNKDDAALAMLDRAEAILATFPAAQRRATKVAAAEWDAALVRAEIRDDGNAFAANVAALRALIPRMTALPLPRDADRALRIERSFTFLANSLWYPGQRRAALAAYRAAERALSDSRFGTDQRVLQRRAYAAFNISAGLDELGTPQEALAAIRPAVEAVAKLRAFDDSIPARNIENIVRLQFANELARSGRLDAAVIEGWRSIEGRRALAALQPGSYFARRGVPVGMRPLAEILRDGGRRSEACALLRETEAAWAAIEAREPLTPSDRDIERAEVRKDLLGCPSGPR